MNYNDEWNEFLNNLISKALDTHKKTKECDYLSQRQNYIDKMLTTNLTVEQKDLVEEIFFELG